MSEQNIPVNSIYAHDKENVRQHAFELGAVAVLQNRFWIGARQYQQLRLSQDSGRSC